MAKRQSLDPHTPMFAHWAVLSNLAAVPRRCLRQSRHCSTTLRCV